MGKFTSFYDNTGEHGDVVLSSRVRLSRNIDGLPFPVRLSSAQKQKVTLAIGSALSSTEYNFRPVEINSLYPFEAVALAERHLISPGFASGTEARTAFISEDESLTVSCNDSDHVRIQSLCGGLRLEDALSGANAIDDILDMKLHFAFDNHLGYLNQNMMNIGTGMRASVLMHLPALSLRGEMNRVSSLVTKLGINVRGSYGEAAAIKGDIYRMSNSICLGLNEEDAIANLKAIVMQIETKERSAAEELINDIGIKDRILRAYALLSHAMLLSSDEMMELLSLVRMGAVYGIVEAEPSLINELFVYMQNACMCTLAGEKLTSDQCSELRAQYIRENLFK